MSLTGAVVNALAIAGGGRSACCFGGASPSG